MASPLEKKLIELFQTLVPKKSQHASSTLDHPEEKDNVPIADPLINDSDHEKVDVPVKSCTSPKSNVDANAFVSSVFEEGEASKKDEGNTL